MAMGEIGYLTKRQIEVLDLYVQLHNQAKVADKLRVRPSTISQTLKVCREKLAKSKETLEYAREKGYVEALDMETHI
jgi:transcriptional regulator